MEALRKVVEVLEKQGGLPQRLQESEVQEGLRQLEAILVVAVEGEPRAVLKWSKQQLDFVIAVVDAVLCASGHLVADGGDKEVVEQIFGLTVEFCLQALHSSVQKSGTAPALLDEEMQQKLWLLLETAILEGKGRHRGASTLTSLADVPSEIPTFDLPSKQEGDSYHAFANWSNKEAAPSSSQETVLSENILELLASEHLLTDKLNGGGSNAAHVDVLLKPGVSVVAATQQYAVVHLKCITRLLSLCKAVLMTCQKVESEEEDRILQGKVAYVSSILVFLIDLARACVHYQSEEEERNEKMVDLATAIPVLFQLTYDSSGSESDYVVESNLGCSLPTLLDEFLLLAATFQDDNLFLNLKTYLAASLLDLLRAAKLRQEGPSGNQQLSLACTPHVISRLLGLFQDVRAHSNGVPGMPSGSQETGLAVARAGSSRGVSKAPLVCQLRSQKFDLNEVREKDEHLQVVFASDGDWVDNLVAATALLHAQGLKESSVVETASSVHSEEDSAVGSVDSVTVASEDDALFGDLFSESGRHSVNSEGNAQTCSSAKKLDGLYNTPLQATCQVISFLKDCVFSREWHLPTFQVACKQLSKEHLDVFLQIHGSQSSIAGSNASVYGSDDLEVNSDLLSQLHKGSFDLIEALAVRQVLSETLETHLANQILKEGDSGRGLTTDILVLLARLLISRHTRKTGDETDDPLVFMLWKNFVDSLVSKARSKLVDTTVEKVSASLPPLFHMEVLFMAFHSVSTSGRLKLFQSLLLALKSLCGSERHAGSGSSLAVWSLLVSRLVLAIRYIALYFNTFPKWVLLHLRNSLRPQSAEGIANGFVEDDRLIRSWPAILARSIPDEHSGDEQHALSEVCSEQLFDVSEFCAVGLIKSEGPFDSQIDLGEVSQVLNDLLETWRDKTVRSVEELLVERYVYLLSWSILQTEGTSLKPALPWDMKAPPSGNRFGADFCFGLGRSLQESIYQEGLVDVKQWAAYMVYTFASIEEGLSGGINQSSWQFLRQGASLNLLLSSLQAGVAGFSQKLSSVGPGDHEDGLPTTDGGLLEFLVEYVTLLLEDGAIMQLLKRLSSLLRWYVDAARSSVAAVLSENPSHDVLTATDLLLRGLQHGSAQLHLLELQGINVAVVQSLLRRGSFVTWQTETVGLLLGPFHDARNFKDISNIISPSLLHGFPSSSHPASAAVVSCMLSLEGILETMEAIFTMQGWSEGCLPDKLEIGLLEEIVGSVMTMSLDSTFDNIRSKWAPVLDSLVPSKEEQASCSDLYSLRQVEDLLCSLSGRIDVDEVVREGVIVQAVDVVNRIDTARSPVLKLFYFPDHENEGSVLDDKKEQGWRLVNARSLVGSGSLAPFVDALHGCCNEVVNLKILHLLLEFLSSENPMQLEFKLALQEKFLEMDTTDLSAWLELRLLGSNNGSLTGSNAHVVTSPAVRELACNVLQMLVNPSADGQDHGLRSHLVTAMLMNLERAFVNYDVTAANDYFGLLVQLAVGEGLLKQVLSCVGSLIEKLAADGNHLESLKGILAYLNSIFVACGAHKVLAQSPFPGGKLRDSGSGFRNIGPKSKAAVAKKNPEHLLHAAMDPSAPGADCDATSVDEDEDDVTSDGELASLDRDDEDDGSVSEKALASKVCTFTSSGSNFLEQHWYFCYTCDLTAAKGCCSVCARVCHRGHKVVYSRLSRFFCDCGAGAGGVRGASCLCLKPRKYVSLSSALPAVNSAGSDSFLPLAGHVPAQSDSESDVEDEDLMDGDGHFNISLSENEERDMLSFLTDLNIEGQVLSLCQKLLTQLNLGQKVTTRKDEEVQLGDDKLLVSKSDILQLKRAYKSGSLDMKIKADYSNARDLKSHLVSGSLVKTLLTISSRGRLAAGEGDKVTIFDVGQLIGQPTATTVTVDKTTVKPLSKNAVRFELVQLAFNSVNENYLAVAGYEDCQVFTVNTRGEVTDRLAVELALLDAHIRRVAWVPGSQVQLMVVTNRFLKIYDLSQDKISPTHYFTVLEDSIADACLVSRGQGQLVALVLSQQGVLYSQHVSEGGDSGARILTENIQLPDSHRPAKGISLSFSASYKLLFMSFGDHLTLIGRLNADLTKFEQVSSVLEAEQEGKTRPAGLHHWKEIFEGSGLFVSLSSQKSNSAGAVLVGAAEMQVQQLRISGNASTLRVDGVAAYTPVTKERNSVLVLHDDGSLQVFSYIPSDSDAANVMSNADNQKQSLSFEVEQVKKLGAVILGSRAHSGTAPVFPLDFFEKTTCITADIKLGGDVLRNNDSEGAKLSLASDEGFLEGPSANGFKILVYNTSPEIVMVGCRVQVGNTSASHIPSELRLFQRTIRLEEGVRSWYDVPFTNSEALLADEEFTLTVGPTFNGSSLPRLDTLEVYGRSKEDFGWKEKLDAVLDLESQGQGGGAPGSSVGTSGRGTKVKLMQSASALEQVFSDSFHLLHNYYLAYRSQIPSDLEEVKLEQCRSKCVPVLETVFESDRQPLLQSAARHVLSALFPVKETYYQAKDSMRLSGVARSCPVLASRISAGGTASAGLIQEFSAQMHAVCKIALHRQSNLAKFLDRNGTSIVDGLVNVLWEILTWEQHDAQTINNLVIPMVDLIYGYAECLALHASTGVSPMSSVAPAVALLHKLLFSPDEAVRTSCSLAISSTLLQVPLPKQTMLAMDDIAENSRAPSIPSDSGSGSGGGGQVMMDEDASTASVQYCCDGCSTVPILRQRWHCNICPDFDLCEACYEVMDADQLPPPHSRDHPMSAIPIDMDLPGGDHSDLHFSSIDELSDESLLQMATELSLQANGSPVSFSGMDGNENILQSVPDEVKGAPVSASKSAVNGLLLQGLVEEIQGWMRRSTGAQALPVMQLFYRLASAASGPLAESSSNGGVLDLERLIKFMLQEMDLNAPLTVKLRSNFGEVAILTFMFFTLVLRNWHQPGSEQPAKPPPGVSASDPLPNSQQSPGTAPLYTHDGPGVDGGCQLDRACAVLRQQSLINYLLSIIQQLTYIFKSSTRGPESQPTTSTGAGCGSLLNVRREFASGSYTPFFSDSYAKAHRGDLFGDFHRLLLESAFRLTYSLIRPEKSEKANDKEQVIYKSSTVSDLKLDGWQEVLCNFINNPHTTFIRKYARRLLLHLCGTKGHYYNVRDAWQLNREVKRLYKLAQKSGGFQVPVSYERSVKLVKCLTVIAEVTAARPRNWQKYCTKHVEVLQFLLSGIFSFGEESVVQTLKLLMLVFYSGKEVGAISKLQGPTESSEASGAPNSTRTATQTADAKKKGRTGSDDGSSFAGDKSYMDMEQAVDQLAAEDGKILDNFIDSFLLGWNSASVRLEAKSVLHGAWNHGKQNFRLLMLRSLLERIPSLPSFGQNIVEYTDLLTWLLGKGTPDAVANSQELALVQGCIDQDAVKGIFGALCAQNELIANHPNSRIYTTLAGLVEFDGYYLESEPCLACSSPELPYTRMKLDNLKSETKFTDNRILVKCVGSHTIQSVTMNVHDARRSKSVRVLNLYYNNRAVADLSELKNNWSLWKRARSCHLSFNQTELKVEFPIPITACNFMIELDSFYENLQASSLESLQCPRCSRYVTDKHGICSNCHENAYQCRQCRNINYENLDSFLCNECGYSKYGRFEFNFMAKPSFTFDCMENDDDMKKGLVAIETESENAHRRYQQLLGFKKPLLKLVSSIGETELDSQQKDSVQQMIVSLPGSSSFKINRKIAILGVLYGEKCKMAFDSVSKSVQTLQGLRRVLMTYLERKRSAGHSTCAPTVPARPTNRCFGCANTFVGQCLEWLQVLAKQPRCREQLVAAGILRELFENNIHQGPKAARIQARTVLCTFTEGDAAAVSELNNLIKQKTMYCLEHHRSMDVAACVRDELLLLSETCSLTDDYWEDRLRIVFQLLFRSIQVGARHPVIAEHIILPCLRIVSQACTPPKSEAGSADSTASTPRQRTDIAQRLERQERAELQQKAGPRPASADSVKSAPDVHADFTSNNSSKLQSHPSEKGGGEQEARGQDANLKNYIEWKNGSTYVDLVRRQNNTMSQLTSRSVAPKVRKDSRRGDSLALKYLLKWKKRAYKGSVTDELSAFEESSWVHELVLSACSQAIRLEMCALIEVLCAQSPVRRAKFLNLLMNLLPSTRAAGESAAEYFDLLFKMVDPEDSRLFLTVRGFLRTSCSLITEEVTRIEAQEWSVHTDISQGYILHKLIELLSKFLLVPNIRTRFMKEDLLAQILHALLALRGLVVQKTKLTSDCGRLLRELLDSLLQESYENKRHFVRACTSGLQSNCQQEKKDRTSLFILEQLCDIICPTKPEQAYMMVFNKAHTQEEFIRGSMTKNPYSSLEIGPLMRDVKNKICHQLELLGLIEDDYGMELLVAGNIIALDLSVAQVYEQVWRKAHQQAAVVGSSILAVAAAATTGRDCPPMTVTYRLQGLDGDATEPMIQELEEDREESQDPEVEFAIAGVMRECGGLDIILSMVQKLSKLEMKAAQQEELSLVLKLLMFCCKIRANRQALLQLGALSLLLEAARRAFSTDAAEPAEGLLLIVESLVSEANDSDLRVSDSFASSSSAGGEEGTGVQAASAVHMFLEKLSHPTAVTKSNKQQRNNETVARILPYLTYGEEAAMEVLIDHFIPYLQDWTAFDQLMKQHHDNTNDDAIAQRAAQQQLALENFVRVTESIKLNPNGERLKSLIMERGITTGAIAYLKGAFPMFGKGTEERSTPEWVQGLEMPSVPIILSMLRGLARGHFATQQSLDKDGVLPLLHALERVPGDNEIGARAENLLDTLSDKESKGEGFLQSKVSTLRHATRDETRRRLNKQREEVLSGMGMRREVRSDGGERIVVAKPDIEGLEEVEEEEAGLSCMVCREGYKLRPKDMLGAYCYSKRMNLALGMSSHLRAEWVYTTVSHFNVIHFQCHQEAKRADASLKNPKKEWEGAALRNSETLCNNLFPLRGPAVPLAQYARCVDQYWDNLNALGRADGSRLRLLIHDIVMMLARFATGSSFSVDSKGGGRESNSRLLPFMVQMARHLLDQGGASQRRGQAKALATYLSPPAAPDSLESGFKPSTPPTPTRAGSIDESVQFMMVQSLLLQSLEDWQHHRRTFLQRAVLHAYVQYKNGRSLLPTTSLPSPLSSSTRNSFDFVSNLVSPETKQRSSRSSEEPKDEIRINLISREQLFTVVQPMLVFVGLVDQMQQFLKGGGGGIVKVRDVAADKDDRKSSHAAADGTKDDGSVHCGIEAWETSLKDRLHDVGAILGFAKDMLEWLEEMQGAQDIQEALDVMGALGDALTGSKSCEDFVRDAIASGQFR